MYKVKLIENNDDLKVVNAARVSFHKEKREFDEGDRRLLNYLARHAHWTPFAHSRITLVSADGPVVDLYALKPHERAGLVVSDQGAKARHSLWGWASLLKNGRFSKELAQEVGFHLHAFFPESARALDVPKGDYYGITTVVDDKTEDDPDFIDYTLREEVPIFVARQRFKHATGFVYNEVSRRYVDDSPKFFLPKEWRKRPEGGIKQGSGGALPEDTQREITESCEGFFKDIKECYEKWISEGVAPEQARMLLPQAMMTEYYVTGSLSDWRRAYYLRKDPHAQIEIQQLADKWQELIPTIRG